MRIKFLLALWTARFLRLMINLLAKGRGTNLPGRVALKIDSGFISHFQRSEQTKVIYITGTNGKSTTTNIIAALLKKAGIKAAINLEGANLAAGVAVTLLQHATAFGRLRPELIVMETDERFLPIISHQLAADWLLVTNIQKDQVQRNGEPDIIYRKITESINRDTLLFLNNEEPNAASLSRLTDKSIFYGVQDNGKSFVKRGFFTTTMPCPLCSEPIRFARYNIDNIGSFFCSGCSFASQKLPAYFAHNIDFAGKSFMVGSETFPLPYDAPYFLYCYIAAIAIARELGIDWGIIRAALADFVNISGRLEQLRAADKTITYIRMKQENPETLQSALDYIAQDGEEKIFMLGLDELTDFRPHYTNTFYAFDCDFDALVATPVQRYICFSGTVAFDAANRLAYAGVPKEKISVLPTNDDRTIIEELNRYDCPNVYLITWLYKYKSLEKYLLAKSGGSSCGGE
jgi:UDP-N-acetylmuramyl tripeptide synthase